MILGDTDIMVAVRDGRIGIKPFNPNAVQPASYDLRLDNKFISLTRGREDSWDVIDPRTGEGADGESFVVPPTESHTMWPGELILASTYERVELNDEYAGRFEGKSSLGRLGLLTHVTAGFIDPGFRGTITIELKNLNNRPLRIYPGMKIGQLCVFEAAGVSRIYGAAGLGSHYQDQRGPTTSVGHRQFSRIDVDTGLIITTPPSELP